MRARELLRGENFVIIESILTAELTALKHRAKVDLLIDTTPFIFERMADT